MSPAPPVIRVRILPHLSCHETHGEQRLTTRWALDKHNHRIPTGLYSSVEVEAIGCGQWERVWDVWVN